MPHLSRPSRRQRTVAVGAAVAFALAGLAACGSDDEGQPASEQLAEIATAGLAEDYVATYSVEREGVTAEESVTVSRAGDRLRLDVSTEDGVAAIITTPDGTVTCQDPAAEDEPATCIQAAGPGAEPPAALDPGLRGTFDTSLRTLAAGVPEGGPVTVSSASAAEIAGAGGTVQCFLVEGAAETVDGGTYCFAESGVLASVTFPSGTITLTELADAPGDEAFDPPATPSPLAD